MIDGSCRGSAAACVSPQKCLTLVFCVTADRFVQAIREVLRQSTDLEARGIRLFASTAELVLLLLLQKKIAPGVEEPAERQLDGLLELLQEILPLWRSLVLVLMTHGAWQLCLQTGCCLINAPCAGTCMLRFDMKEEYIDATAVSSAAAMASAGARYTTRSTRAHADQPWNC
eukprot:7469-Heterococcus_DN1.PRE.1